MIDIQRGKLCPKGKQMKKRASIFYNANDPQYDEEEIYRQYEDEHYDDEYERKIELCNKWTDKNLESKD